MSIYLLLFVVLLLSIKYEEIILTYIFLILYFSYVYYTTQLSFLFWFLIIIYSSALALIFIITIMLFNISSNFNIKSIYDFVPSKIYLKSNKFYLLLLISLLIIYLYIPSFELVYNNILTVNFNVNNYLSKIVINLYYNYFFSSILILKLLLLYLFLIFKILK